MKRLVVVLLVVVVSIGQISAQNRPRFDPKRFEMELQQFITVDAGLTPIEAAKFFPLFTEMQDKQRTLFDQMNLYRHIDTSDDKASLQAIKKMDEIDVEMKKLQQQYHLKFCKVLPAGKVLKVLQADEKFHRQVFKKMTRRNNR